MTSAARQILELARWAPSGDNTQPWRFEIVADDHIVVYAFDTRDFCLYDLDGHASQLAVGAMLETLRLAAGMHGLAAVSQRRAEAPDAHPVFDVRLAPDPTLRPEPIAAVIEERTVQRRVLSPRRLTSDEKATLAHACLPSGYHLLWFETAAARWRVARTIFKSAHLRLTIREAFETHRRVIEWNAQYSEEKMPDCAIGLDPITRRLMRWTMRDWHRVEFFNRYLAGTVVPRIQLDLLPSIACGAHVFMLAADPPQSIDDFVSAGAAVQRFWLTAASVGLQHQPQITPLIFARYAKQGRAFSKSPNAMLAAEEVRAGLEGLIGPAALARAVWAGRVGAGRPARSRSLRLPLEKLLLPGTRAR